MKNINHILEIILRGKGLTWQQIESFNYFINTDLKKIVYNVQKSYATSRQFSCIKFYNLKMGITSTFVNSLEIPITPQHSRICDLTYRASMFVDVCCEYEKKTKYRLGFELCRIPIMLQSNKCILHSKHEKEFISFKECTLDPGGYFIVKGNEKVILIQEKMSLNRISIEHDSLGNICALTCSNDFGRRIRDLVILKDKKLYFRNSLFIEDIPLFIVFTAIGFDKDDDIIELIGREYETALQWSLYEAKTAGILTTAQAIRYVVQRLNANILEKKNYIINNIEDRRKIFENSNMQNLLDDIFSRNIKTESLEGKGIFLSIMVRKIFLTLDRPTIIDNKDYYGSKRLELAGQIVSLLFEDLFRKTEKEMEKFYKMMKKKKMKKTFEEISSIRSDMITNGLEYAFSTGNWLIKKFQIERNGVTQVLSRLSFISTISVVTKITSQNEKIRKIRGPRSLQTSQWGMVCPTDTPEGESCGLVKYLTILAHVTTDQKSFYIKKICYDLGAEKFFFSEFKTLINYMKSTKLFINGQYVGVHKTPAKFLFAFRALRRSGMINRYVSIFWDTFSSAISILTDPGRICRPLIVINSGRCLLKKFERKLTKKGTLFIKDLIRRGFLEFLDVNEQNNANIAYDLASVSLDTSHLEITSEVILGVCGNLIPFLDHNQSPRNTYQCAMGKQALSSISYNQNQRQDTVLSILIYTQKPLVRTKAIYFSGNNRLTSGINACVCIMSFSGFDIEDSIILNRSSVERGFFRSILLRKHKILVKNFLWEKKALTHQNLKLVGNPDSSEIQEEINSTKKNLFLSTIIQNFSFESEQNFFSHLSSKHIIGELAEKIIFSSDSNELFFVKLILRQIRTPEVGDKFSSRHGQKGVCGLLCFQTDLPFSNDGIIPDLIMNPHGFPSRMTIGKMIEILNGKFGSSNGIFRDGTPFIRRKKKSIRKLQKIGYNPRGKDFFFSGITGQPLEMDIFSGPVFYQKLKHMVKDKIHARSMGSRSTLTRQPTEGRGKGGGLRFGEMEKDCLIGYGASESMVERLLLSSDLFFCNFDPETGLSVHKKNKRKIISIKLPYACKLLFQELQSMNILPRLVFENKKKNLHTV